MKISEHLILLIESAKSPYIAKAIADIKRSKKDFSVESALKTVLIDLRALKGEEMSPKASRIVRDDIERLSNILVKMGSSIPATFDVAS